MMEILRQMRDSTPRQLQRIGDAGRQLGDSTVRTLRGIGRGATGGLINYPAASLMVLIDKVMADNPQLSYGEALQLIKDQRADDRGTIPGQVSEIVGAFAPGSIIARGGAGALRLTGAGAAQGGAAGFSENEDLGNAALGTLLGAAGGATGAGAARVQGEMARSQLQQVLRQQTVRRLDEVMNNTQRIKDLTLLREMERNPAVKKMLAEQIASLKQSTGALNNQLLQGHNLTRQLPKMSADEITDVAGKVIPGRTFRETAKVVGVPAAALGLGAAAASATGQIHPGVGAAAGVLGAVLTGGRLNPATQYAAGQVARVAPNLIRSTGTAAPAAVTSQMTRAPSQQQIQQPQAAFNWDEFEVEPSQTFNWDEFEVER